MFQCLTMRIMVDDIRLRLECSTMLPSPTISTVDVQIGELTTVHNLVHGPRLRADHLTICRDLD